MTKILTLGSEIDLTDVEALNKSFYIKLKYCGKNNIKIDVDPYINVEAKSGEIIDFIYFGNTVHPGVRHIYMQNKYSRIRTTPFFRVDLTKLRDSNKTLYAGIFLYPSKLISRLSSLEVQIINPINPHPPIFKFRCEDIGTGKSLTFLKLSFIGSPLLTALHIPSTKDYMNLKDFKSKKKPLSTFNIIINFIKNLTKKLWAQ